MAAASVVSTSISFAPGAGFSCATSGARAAGNPRAGARGNKYRGLRRHWCRLPDILRHWIADE
eukprot:1916323-Prorocentrum_lima.AAC.1